DVGDEIEVVGTNGGLYLVNDITSTSMTLNYSNGSPANALQTGSGNAAIGPRGLRYRITAYSAQQLTVERLTSAGGVDVDWPGFTALNSSTSRVTIDPTSLEGGWRGPFPACPVSEKTNFVEIDVFCPEGLCGVGREGQ
ncbi:TPA: phage tail protein, partial [Pseudomonas aeruginosa]